MLEDGGSRCPIKMQVNKMTMKKLLSLAFAAILVLSAIVVMFRVSPVFAQEPYVGVYPPYTISSEGETFTININVSSTVPFVGYQFYLYWNRTYINVTGMTETPPSAWNPIYVGRGLQWNYNATHGRIERGVMDLHIPFVEVTGSFTVATITFSVIESPSTPTVVALDLGYEDTGVWDQMGNQITPYRVYDGDVTVTGGPETTIAVYPSELRRYQGLPFPINITISAVQDLYGFDTYLRYDQTLLNAISITEGPFLRSAGTTIEVVNEINNAEGYVRYALALMGAPAGADGSGTLFTVTFEASHSTTGTTDLNLEDVKLSNSEAEPIPRTVLNGSVTVVEFERIDHLVIVNGIEYYITTISTSEVTNFEYDHSQRTISFDIEGAPDVPGILNITIPKALIILPQGDTFIVLFDDEAIPSTRTENATHYLLSFTYSHSSHTIQIKQTLIGDLNGDQKVSMVDIVTVNLAYDATPTDPRWNPLADLASPWGKIDIFDFVKVSSKYNRTWP
jgi:hypothetical protein